MCSTLIQCVAKTVKYNFQPWFRRKSRNHDSREFASSRHRTWSRRKAWHNCRQSSKMFCAATSITREGMRMLFSWLLKHTKCGSCVSRNRFASASEPWMKKISVRRLLGTASAACTSKSHSLNARRAFVSAGTNANGRKRNVGGFREPNHVLRVSGPATW